MHKGWSSRMQGGVLTAALQKPSSEGLLPIGVKKKPLDASQNTFLGAAIL